MIKRIQSYLDANGIILRRKTRWTDVPLSILPSIVSHYCQTLDRKCLAVQVGANDGQANDHMRWCIKYCNVKALLIEPMPGPYQRLAALYNGNPNVITDQCAVSDHDGHLKLYAFDETSARKISSTRVASFSREHVEQHRDSHASSDTKIIEYSVRTKKFATVMQDHGISKVDLLAIDAEGMDCVILNNAFDVIQPSIVYFEHAHVDSGDLQKTLSLCNKLGYIIISLAADTVCLKSDVFMPAKDDVLESENM